MTESNAVIPASPRAVSLPRPEDEWKLKTNAVYQEVMKSLMSLVTASLILPVLFIRDFLGVPSGPIREQLRGPAYWSWIFLFASLLSGMVFYWFSAKYLKVVCGGHEDPWWKKSLWRKRDRPAEDFFESGRDFLGGAAVVCFIAGLLFFAWFICLRPISVQSRIRSALIGAQMVPAGNRPQI
jgi:drug/metabolite transporter (DMT)-like permease